MELIAIIVSVASLITNIVIVKKVTDIKRVEETQPLTMTLESLPIIETECQCTDCPKGREHEATDPIKEEVKVSVPKREMSLSPWQNRNNIPWNESISPAPQPVTNRTNGPLERPAGFV